MKIVHFCLSCFYIDGYAYQENQLVAQHVTDGHEVTVIASTETYNDAKVIGYREPADYMGTDNARVIRLPYVKGIPHKYSVKIRAYHGVEKLLSKLKPDVIIFHGLCAWELLTVVTYVSRNKHVLLYADCHEDFNNSARGFFSKWLLHWCFYRFVIRLALPKIKKILCVTQESIDFAHLLYGIPLRRLEYYPLGGKVFDDQTYMRLRESTRRKYGWQSGDRIFLQSGKLNIEKKLLESLHSFSALKGKHLKFVVAGALMTDIEEKVKKLIDNDLRVVYLGWVDPELLQMLLCAADIYVQPGSQSATMQMSLCCRCAVVLDDVISHRKLFNNNGFLIGSHDSIDSALASMATVSENALTEMSNNSALIANQLLDYRKLANRVLN